jgi:hypothetical protein
MTLITFRDGKVVLRDGKVGTERACCCGSARAVCGSPCAVRIELDGVDQSLAECGEAAVIAQLGPALVTPMSPSFVTTCNSTVFDMGREISAIPAIYWKTEYTPPDSGGIVSTQPSFGFGSHEKEYYVREARSSLYPNDGIGVEFTTLSIFSGRSQEVWLDQQQNAGYIFGREYTKEVQLIVQCRHGTPDGGFYPSRFGPPSNLNTTACSACGGITGSPQWVISAWVYNETTHQFNLVNRNNFGNYVSQASRRTRLVESHSLQYSFSHASPIIAALPCAQVLSHEADITKRSFSDREWTPSTECGTFSVSAFGRPGRQDFHLSEVSGQIGPSAVVVADTTYTPRFSTSTSRTSEGSGLPNPITELAGNADFDVATQWPVPLATLNWQNESVPFRVYSTRCCDPSNYDSICNPLP